jgi:regulator of protease activity HflC (stomatin/prohibitin superfamily)
MNIQPKAKGITIATLSVVILLILLFSSIVTIDAGTVGVKLRNGAIAGTVNEGLNFKIPFIESVVKFEARTQKKEVLADAATKDLQQIDATIALNYRIDATKADQIYKELGAKYEENIITPRLQESVKTVTARFTAEELITKRPEVRAQIQQEITDKLKSANVIVEDLSIVNLGFSVQFTQAIEDKQLAEQRAFKAQKDLERIKIEAEQQVTKAKADADSQRLQQLTLTDLLLQKQFIEKWDGKLPAVIGTTTGILDLKTYTQK